MKVKLKDNKNPITDMFCFTNKGYCSTTIEKINSGNLVDVERIPKSALEYVEEVKKETKTTKKKGE